ncbi:MAG: HU family DNA-binding protein [Paramuribaculum sp.]|nr:HU family DNA-binding protein [Paramuribaculum sp.]
MDNQNLIGQLAETTGTPEDKISSLLECFAESVRDCCKKGQQVAIPGFGTFTPVKKDEWISVDPESGIRTLMPPCVEIELRTSVVLRKKLLG